MSDTGKAEVFYKKDGRTYTMRVWGQKDDTEGPWYWSLMTEDKEVVAGETDGGHATKTAAIQVGASSVISMGYTYAGKKGGGPDLYELLIEKRAKLNSCRRRWDLMLALKTSPVEFVSDMEGEDNLFNLDTGDRVIKRLEIQVANLELQLGLFK